jgi:hypothetical protein
MRIVAARSTVLLRLGTRFGAAEAKRLHDVVMELSPLAQLTLDFTDVRDLHDAALVPLARTLRELRATRIVFRGLALQQSRALRSLNLCDGPTAYA